MKRAGFLTLTFSQTIYHRLDEINEVEPVREGYGEGSFLVVRGRNRVSKSSAYNWHFVLLRKI